MSSPSRRLRRQPTRLIPVPQLATGPAPTPDQLRSIGARMFANKDRTLADLTPADLAAIDQMLAAERELQPNIARTAEQHGLHTKWLNRAQPGVTAIAAGVYIAALRTVEAHCPHVPWPPHANSPQTAVVLTTRTAVCTREDCNRAVIHRWHDDGHCELCERPSDTFTIHILTIGAIVISIELCNECRDLFQEAGR